MMLSRGEEYRKTLRRDSGKKRQLKRSSCYTPCVKWGQTRRRTHKVDTWKETDRHSRRGLTAR